jgi:alkyl sulfatase BDS1-like metallo-beta-lactamase superfamily hydrolase
MTPALRFVVSLLKKAREYYDKGDYRFVAQVVNNLVFAEPNNQAAKNLQAESASTSTSPT